MFPRRQRKRDAVPPRRINGLGVDDVRLGRGRDRTNHPGNRRYMQIIEAHVEDYRAAATRHQKSVVLHKVIHEVRQRGRFVYNVDGSWYEVPNETARVKVGQTIRHVMERQGDSMNSMNSMTSIGTASTTESGIFSASAPSFFGTFDAPASTASRRMTRAQSLPRMRPDAPMILPSYDVALPPEAEPRPLPPDTRWQARQDRVDVYVRRPPMERRGSFPPSNERGRGYSF